MEWIQLLKMLSDQQTDQVTQQQIDALTGQMEALRGAMLASSRTILLAVGILFLMLLASDFYYRIKFDRRIKKIEADISRLNSINPEIGRSEQS